MFTNIMNTSNSFQHRAFVDVPGYSERIEVTPGSETFVQHTLAQYASVNSGVKVTRAPNYIGHHQDTPPCNKRKK